MDVTTTGFQLLYEIALVNSAGANVATNANRDLKCSSSEPLVYICIQAKEGSLEGYTMTDGVLSECENLL